MTVAYLLVKQYCKRSWRQVKCICRYWTPRNSSQQVTVTPSSIWVSLQCRVLRCEAITESVRKKSVQTLNEQIHWSQPNSAGVWLEIISLSVSQQLNTAQHTAMNPHEKLQYPHSWISHGTEKWQCSNPIKIYNDAKNIRIISSIQFTAFE